MNDAARKPPRDAIERDIYLFPGELVSVDRPARITTILGSCVAVVLFDPVAKVAGMNHFLLPRLPEREEPSARYGEVALPWLVSALERLGGRRRRFEAKVYGGANLMVHLGRNPVFEIGRQNSEWALAWLGARKIPVVDRDVGGVQARRVTFSSLDFSVEHRLPDGEREVRVARVPVTRTNARKLSVGIVESSPERRARLRELCAQHGFEVLGDARDALEARELVVHGDPSVLLLGAELTPLRGLAFLDKLVRHRPTPVVFVTSREEESREALAALRTGALEVARFPARADLVTLARFGQSLAEKVRAVAARESVSEIPGGGDTHDASGAPFPPAPASAIAIAGNVGAPRSLETILSALSPDCPPVIVVCGTLAPCLEPYLRDLQKICRLSLAIARHGAPLVPGRVYFAPEGVHLAVEKKQGRPQLALRFELPVYGRLPSGHVLFESTAETLGERGLAVLLSGHGPDGVTGLSSVRARGGGALVESPAGALFPFAPRLALETAAAHRALTVAELARALAAVRFIARS